MAKFVCNGAKMKCSMGSAEAVLGVIPTGRVPVRINGNLMATMMDYKPFINIKTFGQCQSLANPTVAAATAACNGKLQKMPCTPNTTTPWIGAKMNVRISGEPALLENSKCMCTYMGIIEITDAGQTLAYEGGSQFASTKGGVASEKKADSVDTILGNNAENEAKEQKALETITIKDIVEILKKIEADKSYEAARHYAMNELDYWKMNLLAKRFVNAPDDETKEKEKDNDPNIMPTRFMLLYGADDNKLECIDDHPDNFDGEETQKICVKKLREGLRLLGYDYVKEEGVYDDYVEHAFLTFHWCHGRVRIDRTCEEEDDPKKPLDGIANKYGISTWKYIGEEYGGLVDHEQIIDELSADVGNKLIAEKIKDKGLEECITPAWFKPGVSYHYVWVPHRLETESNEELKKLQIYNRANGTVVVERDLKKEGRKYIAQMLMPNFAMNDAVHVIDGKVARMAYTPPKKWEVVGKDQIVKTYCTFGKDYQTFENEIDLEDAHSLKSKHKNDINVHFEVKDGNDGKLVVLEIKQDNGDPIILRKVVSNNEAIFNDALKRYGKGN